MKIRNRITKKVTSCDTCEAPILPGQMLFVEGTNVQDVEHSTRGNRIVSKVTRVWKEHARYCWECVDVSTPRLRARMPEYKEIRF